MTPARLTVLLLFACAEEEPDSAAPADTGEAPVVDDCDDPTTFFYDADGDGFGVEAISVSACDAPPRVHGGHGGL